MRKGAFMVGLLVAGLTADVFAQAKTSLVDRPSINPPNAFHIGNREPLWPVPLVKLPIGAIEPRGWLRTQLQLEADGFSGRLTEISEFLKKENNAWLSPSGEGEHGWEEVPYWLRGFGDLGYVLRDERIITETRLWLEAVLAGQREDGYFGPRANLTRLDGKPDLWPNMIMLNALQSYYEYSGDERVLKFMTNYFRWQLAVPEEDFLVTSWQHQRAADNLDSVYWLYNRTGDAWLLDLAEKIHRRTANWTEAVANWHGVNIAQAFRGPAVYFQQSCDLQQVLAACERYGEVMLTYGQVPGGGFAADENCRPGFSGPQQGTETCTWAELMRSFESMLKITADPLWAERCEEIAFNSLPASMTADLKGLHYLTAPNLAACDSKDHAPGFENGGDMLSFDPHKYRCCQHNVGQAWPYFAEHLWLAACNNGLAAVMYAPCVVKAKVGAGDGAEVTITEETRYPFDDSVTMVFSTAQAARFPLFLRIPSWCEEAEIEVNGVSEWRGAIRRPGAYVCVERVWSDGDRVELRLPMKTRIRRWPANGDSVSIERGPLTYALKIGAKQVRSGGTDAWPAYELLPTTPWNYGLVLDKQEPAASFELLTKDWDGIQQPFDGDTAPLELRARAARIPGWQLDEHGLVGKLSPSPVKSDQPVETVTLIPMGCARLRIAAFPTIGTDPDAREWGDAPAASGATPPAVTPTASAPNAAPAATNAAPAATDPAR
ncbi:MAG TPA: glycoside hydrolase family 127 protein [Phycisphaerae bacterium]|nr:glycoside hydrolase family 127 protein [Phycisphaerae bacterium]